MLNAKGERELCYVVAIDNIEPIEGSDNCEAAIVGGWRVMVRKETFKPGDLAIYFEIDSKVPETEYFSFLAKKHYKVKSQKYTFGGKNPGFVSQGLLMHPNDFGWTVSSYDRAIIDNMNQVHKVDDESRFLTEKIGVKYATPSDNTRKGSFDKYKRMAQYYPKAAQTKVWRWLYKKAWGKKLLFVFFGKKRVREDSWPVGKFPGVSKTDQERVENMPWVLNDKQSYVVTQKCDGSSATYILEKKKFGRYEFYVCSRNVRFMGADEKCFYDENVYWEMAQKYNIKEKMMEYLKTYGDSFVCWQGEICGPKIQKNPHGLSENHLFMFHWTDGSEGRWDIREAAEMWKTYNMEVVPIDECCRKLPNTMEEMKLWADGNYDRSVCGDNEPHAREGLVYYSTKDPTFSFKNVSNSYLLSR